jgi:hypothetical protein
MSLFNRCLFVYLCLQLSDIDIQIVLYLDASSMGAMVMGVVLPSVPPSRFDFRITCERNVGLKLGIVR